MGHSLNWKRESGLRFRGDTLAKKLVRVVLILVSGQYQILFEEASHAYHLPISLAVQALGFATASVPNTDQVPKQNTRGKWPSE